MNSLDLTDKIADILRSQKYVFTRSENIIALSFSGESTGIKLVLFSENEDKHTVAYLVCVGALQVFVSPENRVRALEMLNELNMQLPIGGYELRSPENSPATITFKYGFEVFDGNLTPAMVESTMARVLAALRQVEEGALLLV